jgi:type II secretory pathway component PulF
MPWFEYEGLTPGGTLIAGRIEALDSERARQELAQLRIELRELRQSEAPPRQKAGLTEDDLMFFNEQLASLAQAGIALDEGLAQLARDLSSSRLRHWIEEVVQDLRRGIPIDQAIAVREAGLPLLYSRVIRAGIESGELPATLLNLNQHLRLSGDTRRVLWELVSYPIIVLLMAIGIASFFYGTIVPHAKELFKDFGVTLPAITVMMIDIGDHYWSIMLTVGIVVSGLVLIWYLMRLSAAGLACRESCILAIPVIGRVYRASVVARFFRAVATSVATGIPLPQAMRLAGGATGSHLLGRDAEQLASEVEQGHSIFVANQSTNLIPPLFGFCVQVAVGRDALPTAIGQLARSYENRAVHTQAMLRVLLFPALIIIMGSILAVGILAMFLPLVTLINCVSGGG